MNITTGIIILAAGNSSRLGTPKQLLEIKGKALLQHKIDASKLIPNCKIFVVLGANISSILSTIEDSEIIICYNPSWQSGMGSSIKVGLREMKSRFPEITQCILSVCDQPFVDENVFNSLIEKQINSQKDIIATRYQNTLGVPVLFTQTHFKNLLKLTNTQGAKKLIQTYSDDVSFVDFEAAGFDIDTLTDVEKLNEFK